MIDRTFGRIKLSRKCESERKELIHTAEEGQHVLLSKTVEVFMFSNIQIQYAFLYLSGNTIPQVMQH